METMIEKDFDCVKTVRKSRERIARDTQGKSPKEILSYFQDRKRIVSK
jgi:hypothetical protein